MKDGRMMKWKVNEKRDETKKIPSLRDEKREKGTSVGM